MNINLDKYSIFFKKDIIDIYHSWININKPLYIKYYNLIGLLIMSFLVPLDYVLFGNANPYSEMRIIYIVVVLLNLLYIQINQVSLFRSTNKYNFNINLFLPAALFNILYIYYLYDSAVTLPIILLTNFITVLVTTLFALKFWKEQYAINLSSIIVILIFSTLYSKYLETFYLIGIHIFSFILAYFYRRNFILSMYQKYCNMASMVPKNIAIHIAMSDGPTDLNNIFKPKEMFTVCLSSDWRNYQELAKSKQPKYIEKIVQNFYNEVFKELDRIIPEGSYYADWTADELFIIFFDAENNKDKIINNALSFSYLYSKRIFNKINRNMDDKLMYDIGMASGIGLLGLQGPEKLKKTTITGESAGTAKRLETEAKTLRSKNSTNSPILIIDELLYKYAKNSKNYSDGFKKITARTKNIQNKNFYLWLNSSFDRNDRQLKIKLN